MFLMKQLCCCYQCWFLVYIYSILYPAACCVAGTYIHHVSAAMAPNSIYFRKFQKFYRCFERYSVMLRYNYLCWWFGTVLTFLAYCTRIVVMLLPLVVLSISKCRLWNQVLYMCGFSQFLFRA